MDRGAGGVAKQRGMQNDVFRGTMHEQLDLLLIVGHLNGERAGPSLGNKPAVPDVVPPASGNAWELPGGAAADLCGYSPTVAVGPIRRVDTVCGPVLRRGGFLVG